MNKKKKLSKIKLLISDVDGTLTDGAMYYGEHGEAIKRFAATDGMGITMLHRAGIKTGIVTSVNSKISEARAKKLQMEYIKLDRFDKDKALEEIAESAGVDTSEIAFIGDDINDISALKIAGFSACPADAVNDVKAVCDYVCIADGGYGAVRELAEMILSAQDKTVTL